MADLKQRILESSKGSPRKCYNVLRQPFHRDCRIILNGMVVTYKVSY